MPARSNMKVVLGIGNPGREYAATRHNAGFRVLDLVAGRLPAGGWRRKFRGRVAEGALGGEKVLLVKPGTFVNLSGECAREVLAFHKVEPSDLLVVCDDVNLKMGRLRCRRSGRSGGHHGLDSVAERLGTDAFPRLRVGVGLPWCGGKNGRGGDDGERDLVGHVLSGFAPSEAEAAERAESRAADAVMEWIVRGTESCMNRFNGPEDPEAGDGQEGPAPGREP